MDSDDDQFKGIIGYIQAGLLLFVSPVILTWASIEWLMREMEEQERRRLFPKEKMIFYAMGVYLSLVSTIGLCVFFYAFFEGVSWLASMMS